MLFSDEVLDKFLLFRPLKEIQMIGTDNRARYLLVFPCGTIGLLSVFLKDNVNYCCATT